MKLVLLAESSRIIKLSDDSHDDIPSLKFFDDLFNALPKVPMTQISSADAPSVELSDFDKARERAKAIAACTKYGNEKLPGVAVSEQFRFEGSIWQGYTQATWFKVVKVNGTDAADIRVGTIMKELSEDGSYTPITESDIVAAVSGLPGVRLGIVADKFAKTGSTTTVDDETVSVPSSVLIGIAGVVDRAKLYVGDKAFSELTDAQKINLNTQLEAWNFQLVNVIQA